MTNYNFFLLKISIGLFNCYWFKLLKPHTDTVLALDEVKN